MYLLLDFGLISKLVFSIYFDHLLANPISLNHPLNCRFGPTESNLIILVLQYAWKVESILPQPKPNIGGLWQLTIS